MTITAIPMVSYELVICKLCKSVELVVLKPSQWMTFESVIQVDIELSKHL